MEVSGRQESASRRTRLWHATRWPRSSEPEIGLRRARPPRLAPAQHGLPCGTDTLTHSNVMTSSKSHLPCPSTFLPPLFITSHETRARSSVRRRRSRSKRSGPFVFARGWKTGCKNSPSSICRRLFGANTLKLLMRRLLRLISAFYRPAYSHFRPDRGIQPPGHECSFKTGCSQSSRDAGYRRLPEPAVRRAARRVTAAI